MNQQLRNRAQLIKELLGQQPETGADLLMDFARQYAAHTNLEDEVILLKLELLDAATPEEQTAIQGDLATIADKVAQNYDANAVQDILAREQALAEKIQAQDSDERVVVRTQNLQKRYRSTNFELQCEDVDFRLGEVTGLVGENATGKSIFLRILAGDLAHDGGDLRYPLFQDDDKRLRWNKLKQQIAYVPQELPKWRGTLLDNIRYEAAIHGIKGADNRKAVDYIIERLGLHEHTERSWQQLSGGYKLRFALAKALVWKARLLIIDEPLANLDIKTQIVVLNDLRNLAKSLRQPMAIVISSQHLHEIEAVADQLLFMRGGKLENLGERSTWGEERSHNTFEFGCALSYAELTERLSDFPHEKLWYDGRHYVLECSRETEGASLLHYLATRQVSLDYYRDISTSIKTKFYETTH